MVGANIFSHAHTYTYTLMYINTMKDLYVCLSYFHFCFCLSLSLPLTYIGKLRLCCTLGNWFYNFYGLRSCSNGLFQRAQGSC